MKKDNLKKAFGATILNVIVACFFVGIVFVTIYFVFGNKISLAVSLINTVSTKKTETTDEIVKIIDNKIAKYPAYGTKYAVLKISKIDLELPVYWGDDYDTLKNGVGHSTGSYMPGEGGSIVMMAHNHAKFFRRFGELKIGDKAVIETDYGIFTYQIFETKIIKEDDLEAVSIQKEKELLMMYTCYPFQNIGYATQRYIVYANLIEGESE